MHCGVVPGLSFFFLKEGMQYSPDVRRTAKLQPKKRYIRLFT